MPKFRPGQSGNPRGRPKKATKKVDEIRAALLGEAPAILDALVLAARAGDPQAARVVLDRCLPPMRPRDAPVSVALPAGDFAEAARALLLAVSSGDVTPDEGRQIAGVLTSAAKVVETEELIQRIEALEAQVTGKCHSPTAGTIRYIASTTTTESEVE